MMRRTLWAGLVVLLVAAAGVAVWMVWRSDPGPRGIIEANGRIEGDQAAIGAPAGGRIVRLAIREGSDVTVGQLIAELASEQVAAQLSGAEHVLHTARERLAQARARAAAAERQLEAAQATVTVARQESRAQIAEAEAAMRAARAGLIQAEAELEKMARDYGRYRELFARELIAAQQLDQAKAAHEVAAGAVDAARAQLTQAEERTELARVSQLAIGVREREVDTAAERLREARAAVETARAEIQTAEASRELARANLEDTRIEAPFSGTVLRRLVEPGEVVAPGTPLLTLVDLSRLHAKVYVTQLELGRIRLGDAARVYTDAHPGRPFAATVAEISQQAEFTPRDVHTRDERAKLVFAVKLAVENPEGILKPGMPADARIRADPETPWPDARR